MKSRENRVNVMSVLCTAKLVEVHPTYLVEYISWVGYFIVLKHVLYKETPKTDI